MQSESQDLPGIGVGKGGVVTAGEVISEPEFKSRWCTDCWPPAARGVAVDLGICLIDSFVHSG